MSAREIPMGSGPAAWEHRRMATTNTTAPVATERFADATDDQLKGWAPTATAIVQKGLWCVIEVCLDAPSQRWEPRLLVCESSVEGIGEAIAGWSVTSPAIDARIAGYTRERLRRVDSAPTALCHLAATPDFTRGLPVGE